MAPAIIVLAYERADALTRLLASLDQAFYAEPVRLVISIDDADGARARASLNVARTFEWRHGEKRIIERPERLGVVGHFLAAGDLSRDYGDVVLLEDDLTVAPSFHEFASGVLDAYGQDRRIAGACLYGLWFNGFTQEPFMPVEDGADVFFLCVPFTQGLCFSAAQWGDFYSWRTQSELKESPRLHPLFLEFGPDEWFPALASYMAETDRYFCFPRVSQTVAWGNAGAHFAAATRWFQAPIQVGRRRFQLPGFDESLAVYDGFFEMLPDRLQRLAPWLAEVNFDVDLNATKQLTNLQSDLVLTTRPVGRAVRRFGLRMYPPELNIVQETPGQEIALAARSDVIWDDWAGAEARRLLYGYYGQRHRTSRKRSLRFLAARLIELARRQMR